MKKVASFLSLSTLFLVIGLSSLFVGCATPRANREDVTYKSDLHLGENNQKDMKAMMDRHMRGFGYGSIYSADFVLFSEFSLTEDLIQWSPESKGLSQTGEEITAMIESAVSNHLCFKILDTKKQGYYVGGYDFDPKSFEAIVFNDKGQVSWLDLGLQKSYTCAFEKVELTDKLTMVIKYHPWWDKAKSPSYFNLTWKFKNKEDKSNALQNSSYGEDAEKNFKKYSAMKAKPESKSFWFAEDNPKSKAILAALSTRNKEAFIKLLPDFKTSLNYTQLIELSLLYTDLGILKDQCSGNPYMEHLEKYPLRKDIVAAAISFKSKYDRETVLSCPKLSQIFFQFYPSKRAQTISDFTRGLEGHSSLQKLPFLSDTLNFFRMVVDTYTEGCKEGQQDQCIYVTQYKKDLTSLVQLSQIVKRNKQLEKLYQEIILKKKIVTKSGTEEFI